MSRVRWRSDPNFKQVEGIPGTGENGQLTWRVRSSHEGNDDFHDTDKVFSRYLNGPDALRSEHG